MFVRFSCRRFSLRNMQTIFEILAEANAKESRLKFVAQFENGNKRRFAIHPKRPSFYNLEGKTILFYFTQIAMLIYKRCWCRTAVTASGFCRCD
jgi:aspartokinase/homoserine dehydrogenase 1